MLSIVLVGEGPCSLEAFATALSQKEKVKVSRATKWKEVWDLLGRCRVDVVVVDEKIADGTALSLVHKLTKQQPLINCAMVSTLTHDEFHEQTEGLGIFMQLPLRPGQKEVDDMMQLLESINVLMAM